MFYRVLGGPIGTSYRLLKDIGLWEKLTVIFGGKTGETDRDHREKLTVNNGLIHSFQAANRKTGETDRDHREKLTVNNGLIHSGKVLKKAGGKHEEVHVV